MPRKIKLGAIIKGKIPRPLRANRDNVKINNIVINKVANPVQYNIQKGASALKGSQVSPPAQLSQGPSPDQAVSILEALGCTVTPGGQDFSLLGTQTDTTTLQNPNMIDNDELFKIKNTYKAPLIAAPNKNNPFWEPDEPLAQKDVLEKAAARKSDPKETTSLNRMTSDLIAYNMDYSSTPTLKYFTYKKNVVPR